MPENSLGFGLRSRARRPSAVPTREALEAVLYDKAYSWELQPGSDVMATCVGVLPKIAADWYGSDYYAGLVTVDHAPHAFFGDATGWVLVPADTALTAAALDDSHYVGGDTANGVYVAWYYAPTGTPPPYAFPEGWTPGNTTGSGPVLPYIGLSEDGTYSIFAGLVDVEAVAGNVPGHNNAVSWCLAPANTPLDFASLDSDSTAVGTFPAGAYMAVVFSDASLAPPTVLPAKITLRPFGIGPIAITDENAGGLIGDVAYVVSGYVYNGQSPEMAQALEPRYVGTLADGDHTLADGDVFHLPHDTFAKVVNPESGGTFTVTGGDSEDLQNASSGWADPYDGYWPFIERYDLAQKKWLPRIPLPMVDATGTYIEALGPVLEATGSGGQLWVQKVGVWLGGVLPLPPEPGTGEQQVAYLVTPTGHSAEDFWSTSHPVAYRDNGDPGGRGHGTPGPGDLWRATYTDPDSTQGQAAALMPALSGFGEAGSVPFAAEGGIGGVIDGKLYFGGGDGDVVEGNEFFVYDPADDSITRLANTPAHNPDYNSYGVLGRTIVYFDNGTNVFTYDVDSSAWTVTLLTSNAGPPNDQVAGYEIDGKLWLVADGRAVAFDSVALALTAKATNLHATGTVFLIDGKFSAFSGTWIPDINATYDPVTDAWTERSDIAVSVGVGMDTEYAGVTYEGVPYLLSSAIDTVGSNTLPGVYGMTSVAADRPRAARLQDKATALAIATRDPETEPILVGLYTAPDRQATGESWMTFRKPPLDPSGLPLASIRRSMNVMAVGINDGQRLFSLRAVHLGMDPVVGVNFRFMAMIYIDATGWVKYLADNVIIDLNTVEVASWTQVSAGGTDVGTSLVGGQIKNTSGDFKDFHVDLDITVQRIS